MKLKYLRSSFCLTARQEIQESRYVCSLPSPMSLTLWLFIVYPSSKEKAKGFLVSWILTWTAALFSRKFFQLTGQQD
jgi:hypothetical protein